ncbi:MFS transporter, partial [Achromobacter xylosoxidans]
LLLAGLLSFAIDGVGVALAPTLEVAMALRVFGGLASAVIIPNAFALVADIMPRDRQAAAMGVVMLGMTAGIAMGPALAGLLTDWIGWRAPFLLTSAGCLVACVVSGMSIPRRHAARAAPAQRNTLAARADHRASAVGQRALERRGRGRLPAFGGNPARALSAGGGA